MAKKKSPKKSPKKISKKAPKTRPAKKSVGAKKERKPKPQKVKAPKPKKAASGGSVALICSECYEDFHLTGGEMDQTISCPECLHVGKKPAEDFLRTVQMHKDGEKKSLMLAMVVLALFGAAAAALIAITSPQVAADEGNLPTIVGGIGGLLLIVGIFLTIRYERNRWEIYF